MKTNSIRKAVQVLCTGLTIVGLIINLQITLTILMIIMALAGTFYCGWICPFGTVQEFVSKFAKLLKIKQRKIPKAIHNVLKYSRYLILALTTFLTSSLIFNIMSFDPKNNWVRFLMGDKPVLIASVIIIFFTLLSMVYERFYCNYLCYEGAKYSLISLLRPVTITRDKDKCVNCKKCDKVCSMNIEVSKSDTMRNINCINCFKCIDSCPIDSTLKYGFRFKNLFNKTYIVIVSLVLLLAGVLIKTNDFIYSEYNIDPIESITGISYSFNDSSEIIVDIPFINKEVIIGKDDEDDDEDKYDDDNKDDHDKSEDEQDEDDIDANIIKTDISKSNTDAKDTVNETVSTTETNDTVKETASTTETNDTVKETASTTETKDTVKETVSTTETKDTVKETVSTTETKDTVEVTNSLYKDGTYEGVAEGFRGKIYVSVTVKSDIIESVVVTKHRDDRKWYNRAKSIINDILNKQSTDVKVISGATYSSQGIKDAVKAALEKAK